MTIETPNPLTMIPKRYLGCLLVLCPLFVDAQIDIILRKSFVDSIKNRLTISVDYFVDKAHPKPNAPAKDGDLHFAGRSHQIGLPIVAEVMNAKLAKQAVDYIHLKENSNSTIALGGVWRLWCEHANQHEKFLQGEFDKPYTTTNPGHVFEIHPALNVGPNDVTALTLKTIRGFEYKDAQDAFYRYANVRCKISAYGADRVKISTSGIGYNYVKFRIKLLEQPWDVEDGAFAFCEIQSLDGDLISHKTRMGFVKGSAPYTYLKKMKVGDEVNVTGISRIDLALVSWRLNNGQQNPDVLEWNLPYEMVVVGVK